MTLIAIAEHERQYDERLLQRLQANREELAERIARATPRDGAVEPLEGLVLARLSSPSNPLPSVAEPSFCVIAQGRKEVFVEHSRYEYDPFHYLLATVELPRFSRVIEASPERPYLSLTLRLEPSQVTAVLLSAGYVPRRSSAHALDVSPLDERLLDAVVRLVRLLDTPEEAPVLMPLVTQEIIYRLLVGEQGRRLCHLALRGGVPSEIASAVSYLRRHLSEPLRVERLARELGMSVSSLHHHFKAVTGLSPLQYLKQLRLQEARHLMLNEGLDATSAAFRVGYQDVSHFNRDYRALFGLPPARDMQRLRQELESLAVSTD
ncbi:AraC family transcriptional regulator [Thermogemmatispora tikiterensis]|uniref:AraC family transcriptional regulator n=1 Tax=Thermogemmatispora tikiterensis TaxID=1825093 RepID=A0A328VT90_9CHLR|nr:AraC family transcriptional regulator [Thermogemmatispora tikiterensis]RAQ98504.1 AraC family transcriptional regulator [Thermogemmatispora tikiterensis]